VHDGNAINHVVSATDLITGHHPKFVVRRDAGGNHARENATTFGVFDTFDDESGRQAHLMGQIAAALSDAAQTKLSAPPVINSVDMLGVKIVSRAGIPGNG
jgi:quinol monooxygenase YgiN